MVRSVKKTMETPLARADLFHQFSVELLSPRCFFGIVCTLQIFYISIMDDSTSARFFPPPKRKIPRRGAG